MTQYNCYPPDISLQEIRKMINDHSLKKEYRSYLQNTLQKAEKFTKQFGQTIQDVQWSMEDDILFPFGDGRSPLCPTHLLS